MAAEGSRAAGWSAAASFAAAFLAGSHHWIHSLLLSLGLAAGSAFMPPWLRRTMLGASFVMVAWSVAWLLRAPQPSAARFWGVGAGACLSVAFLAFAVVTDGF